VVRGGRRVLWVVLMLGAGGRAMGDGDLPNGRIVFLVMADEGSHAVLRGLDKATGRQVGRR